MKTKIFLIVVLLITITAAQDRTKIIPGSKNNLIELILANSTVKTMQSIRIFVEETPEWIEFSNDEINIENIKSLQKETAQFIFNVSVNAPIGEEGSITFRITKGNSGVITKTYNIKVAAPATFEAYQNYPNPFNPSTTIKYSIPQDAFVSIKIFNVLGAKITELENKEMKTGIHEVVFNATNFSSGFYFYIVVAKGIDGTKYFDSKKMILLK
jgi:hypothetical protein